MGKGRGRGGYTAAPPQSARVVAPRSTGSSWSLRKAPTDPGLLLPEWTVPCAPLQWQESATALDRSRDRFGSTTLLKAGVDRAPANRGKIDRKLPGAGHTTLTTSYSKLFKDDPDPFNIVDRDPRHKQCTILTEVQRPGRAGKFAPEHTSTFHPLFTHRVCRPSTFLREDTTTRTARVTDDATTLANRTWSSLRGTGLPADERTAAFRLKPLSETAAARAGKVGNRLGETTTSLKSEFTPERPQQTKSGNAFITGARFPTVPDSKLMPCSDTQPGLEKTRWPDRIVSCDPPAKAPSFAGSTTSLSPGRTVRPSQSSLLETQGASALGGTASFTYRGRESRTVPPPIIAPAFLMH